MLSSAWMRYCLILWTLDVHLCSRSPQGERGLKGKDCRAPGPTTASLPARGAWIERIRQVPPTVIRKSLPARGAWIERASSAYWIVMLESLPARGAWIESNCPRCLSAAFPCRSPQGERGLKDVDKGYHPVAVSSLPARGAWIERPWRSR